MIQLLAWVALASAATPPDFTGKWMLDPQRSQDTNGATIELTIREKSGKMDYNRLLRERDGKQVKTTFKCTPGAKWCKLDENGHKAKVSLWYVGPVLFMAKTGGPSHDATTERKFELSPDGKTLTVEFNNYSGTGKTQKFVFIKQ